MFDAAAGGHDYGDSVLKLGPAGSDLVVRDYFTPFNQKELNDNDDDLGSGAPVLLPDQPGPHPHLLVVAGKARTIYVIDRERMGHYQAGSDSHAAQTLRLLAGSAFGAPAYWNRHVYFLASDDVLRDFAVEQGMLKEVAHANKQFIDPGATPAVSANGSKNAIVGVLSSKHWNEADGPPAVLYAYDAANLAHQLYSSEENGGRDRAGVGCDSTSQPLLMGAYTSARKVSWMSSGCCRP
jgi:hypothetical protein